MVDETHPNPATVAQDQRMDLILQETIHRGSNDLQMIIALLAMQARRAETSEARDALSDAMNRISVLAHARKDMSRNRPASLASALGQVCAALQLQAELQSITINLNVEEEAVTLTPSQITTLALVANELITNAIKHAFEEDKGGSITISRSDAGNGCVAIYIDDDGIPFPDPKDPDRDGLGLDLSKRLMASIGGIFISPHPGSKIFELRLPVGSSCKSIS